MGVTHLRSRGRHLHLRLGATSVSLNRKMIKNERQYKITKAQVARFAKARDTLSRRPNPNGLHPLIAKAQEDAVIGQLEEMENDLREYESLKDGEFQFDSLKLVAELPHVLIKARIAQGLSQKALAERLGLKEQQIQRYEATDYASASLSRIRDVAAALSTMARST